MCYQGHKTKWPKSLILLLFSQFEKGRQIQKIPCFPHVGISKKGIVGINETLSQKYHPYSIFKGAFEINWPLASLMDLHMYSKERIFWHCVKIISIFLRSFRFWGLLMFGSYSVCNIIVLLNMLIAMMSTSYTDISLRSDVEWKFARSMYFFY